MANRPYARRQLAKQAQSSLRKYSTLVGEVIYASNTLGAHFHTLGAHFQLTFELLFEDADEPIVGAMWHAMRNDDLQRVLIKAAASKSSKLEGHERRNLLWAIDKAGRLSEYRNDAIHTYFEYAPGNREIEFYPSDWAVTPSRLEKLERVGYRKLFKCLIGDLYALGDYAIAVTDRLISRQRGYPRIPFPKRPVLRAIQLVQQNPPATKKRKKRHQ
jgi:hypothetical protein